MVLQQQSVMYCKRTPPHTFWHSLKLPSAQPASVPVIIYGTHASFEGSSSQGSACLAGQLNGGVRLVKTSTGLTFITNVKPTLLHEVRLYYLALSLPPIAMVFKTNLHQYNLVYGCGLGLSNCSLAAQSIVVTNQR